MGFGLDFGEGFARVKAKGPVCLCFQASLGTLFGACLTWIGVCYSIQDGFFLSCRKTE